MSQAELKKLQELKKLKKQAKLKKQKEKEEQKDELPQISAKKADALPPVMMQRKGQFEMIPDFLKSKGH